MLSSQAAERTERLDHARALGPAAARASGKGNDRDRAGGERLFADLTEARVHALPGIEDVLAGERPR